ncbi:piggyBac transposable element-derived protein 4-like [Bombyx mori]|uniref:piggyBac transposable element-derived protein 4-like n=1 Tax=Bombyx mori TaxID=7091 RepID=UPI002ED358E5
MVEETNKYAAEFINSHVLKPKSRIHKWKDTTIEEMERFMGVLMVMGISKVPNLHLYWSKKRCYRNEYIANLITRDRFLLLLKFWHFSDNVNNGDKLYKIRKILDIVFKLFTEILKPGRFIVIDETMIPWKGRLNFRQYIKNKAHKYGIKLYKLCTPEGYTYSVIVYTGKDEEKSGAGHGYDVVMKLTKNLLEEGRTLIADNFYTSVPLAEELLKKKTFMCGTLRTNRRGLPKSFISKKMNKLLET